MKCKNSNFILLLFLFSHSIIQNWELYVWALSSSFYTRLLNKKISYVWALGNSFCTGLSKRFPLMKWREFYSVRLVWRILNSGCNHIFFLDMSISRSQIKMLEMCNYKPVNTKCHYHFKLITIENICNAVFFKSYSTTELFYLTWGKSTFLKDLCLCVWVDRLDLDFRQICSQGRA